MGGYFFIQGEAGGRKSHPVGFTDPAIIIPFRVSEPDVGNQADFVVQIGVIHKFFYFKRATQVKISGLTLRGFSQQSHRIGGVPGEDLVISFF